ncbi:Uncharacterised protein [Mycobacteroides abscessus subsp. abscessus]|uniref:Uncharacterized protein n=1 Tax=Mycobacteroides abscessus subsp. abscessus TaxID=1185650 RepID=A0AB38D0X7_9MYCO|nr:hypothetical protein [Mycobacteroides abscessus]SHX06582.1 Uncharacterised protein [Mycobacteroides abscessus subsp. abscessus]SIA11538.1 Uncharacterised protein [Mycobacteroides abscessus subsp. abscessus]SIB13967.1 Uncharacterised protein [Mycobacteroides abscessus subsp. abscessus]SIB14734.1 Uncharacterised protein [Mycobacteroides abscessus subsp. abscessus]SIB17799.1 Uncharacterised protein [Mycobacteroides abscessus subsp. abscessus]
MSNKRKDSIGVLSKTQGMVKLAKPGPPIAVGTRVTGHNLGAVTHIVSIEAERVGEKRGVGITFNEDGSLNAVSIHSAEGALAEFKPGVHLVIGDTGDVVVFDDDNFYDPSSGDPVVEVP